MEKWILLVEDDARFREAFEAGAQGAQSKAVSMSETVEAAMRLTDAGHQEG